MASLVTLDAVKQSLHVDTSADDTMLQLLIKAASQAVITYLKDQAEELFDLEAASGNSPEDADVPEDIQQATILLVGYWYDQSDERDKSFESAKLPAPVAAMLIPYRTPTIA
jgi:hypothetical protein